MRFTRNEEGARSSRVESSMRVRLMRLVVRAARIRAAVGQRPTASLVWRNDAGSNPAGSSRLKAGGARLDGHRVCSAD